MGNNIKKTKVNETKKFISIPGATLMSLAGSLKTDDVEQYLHKFLSIKEGVERENIKLISTIKPSDKFVYDVTYQVL